MSSAARNPNNSGEFTDPLENYDPKSYSDPLERALAEKSVAAIQHEPYASIPSDTPVWEAVARLAGMQVACLLVTENDSLVGVFSDRDVLDRVALEFDNFRDAPVRDVMTTEPVYVYDTDSAAAVLCVMAISGYRHVPVLDIEKKLVGIVSPQRVTRFLLSHVTA